MWDWSDMDENQRSNQEYSCGGFCSRKADTSPLLILPVSQQKEGGLLSFKCKWEYGLNPQRDGLGNGSRMPSGLWHVFIFRKLIHCSYRPEHLKHELWAGHLRAKSRRKSGGRAEEHRVTLRGKLRVIVFLDKLSWTLCFCFRLTSAYITQIRPKSDLLSVLMSCPVHAGPQTPMCRINSISQPDRHQYRTNTNLFCLHLF